MKHYYSTTNRLPYRKRLRNRCIAIALLVLIAVGVGAAILHEDTRPQDTPKKEAAVQESQELQQKIAELKKADSIEREKEHQEDLSNTQATLVAEIAPENAPEPEIIDSVHIKSQKNVFLAEKIDQMLRRYRPDYGVVLVVNAKTNEIIAWGERRDDKVQNQPDYFVKNTFPAASLAKTVTIAAAMESGRYSLDTPIPMRGASHTLYMRTTDLNSTPPTR